MKYLKVCYHLGYSIAFLTRHNLDVALSFEMAQECVRHLVNRKVIVGPRLVADLSGALLSSFILL